MDSFGFFRSSNLKTETFWSSHTGWVATLAATGGHTSCYLCHTGCYRWPHRPPPVATPPRCVYCSNTTIGAARAMTRCVYSPHKIGRSGAEWRAVCIPYTKFGALARGMARCVYSTHKIWRSGAFLSSVLYFFSRCVYFRYKNRLRAPLAGPGARRHKDIRFRNSGVIGGEEYAASRAPTTPEFQIWNLIDFLFSKIKFPIFFYNF